jgi:multidrug efflux system membrane fusion protein
MRFVPILTAVAVTLALYAVVFERDALVAFALGNADTADTAEAEAAEGAAAASGVPEGRAIRVVAVHSKAQTIDSAVVLRGQTQASRQVEVRAETSATVISEPLRKGSFVEKGDLLCRLDPGPRLARLAEARAELAEARSRVPEAEARQIEAQARLLEAQINNNPASKLSEGGYASETRRISTEASVRSAEAGIASAKAGVESAHSGIEAASASVEAAEREISNLSIFAPFAGLLETDAAELGSLMQAGSLCATVIQLDPIKLVGFVPETEVNRVTVGSLAGAKLADGQQVQGRVTFLSRSADPTTRTFQTEISVPNPDMAIRDGQTVEIVIASDGALAHRLPQSALTLNNDGQLGVRSVGEGNIVAFQSVKLLRDDADGVWVEGLPDEAGVIVVGQDFVTEGVTVTPTWREDDK